MPEDRMLDWPLTPPAQKFPEAGSMVAAFEQVVDRFPERPAVFDNERRLTYAALNFAANTLAENLLARLGAGSELTAYLLGQKVNSLQAVWGILKSGKGYVVLDPTFPRSNLKAILLNSDTRVLVTDDEHWPLAEELVQDTSVEILNLDAMDMGTGEDLNLNISPDAFATAIYTSGSSGEPKGLLRTFQTVLYRHPHDPDYQPTDRVLLAGPLTYSQNQHTMYTALRAGACLGLYDVRIKGGADLTSWVTAHQITVLILTPSLFRSSFGTVPEGGLFPLVRFLQLGGEASTNYDLEIFKRCFVQGAWGVAKYASTETGLISKFKFDHATQLNNRIMPVGKVIPGKAVLLLNEQGQSVPTGEIGEIVVQAKAFNTQYWKTPSVASEKLRADPADASKSLFFTGDLGRFRADGNLEHHGRKDTMVKIRGNRIQLEVIDAALRSLPGVTDAATIVHESAGRGKRLVAYLALTDSRKWSVSNFRKELASLLPEYMIPPIFVQLDSLPHTSTGKLARRELPVPTNARPALGAEFVAPRNATEKRIAEIWVKLLELDAVGVDDNFFELGGDSLMALEMTLVVEKLFSKIVPPAFFKRPTISYLTTLLEAEERPISNSDEFAIQGHTATSPPKPKKTRKITTSQLKKLVDIEYLLDGFDRFVEWLVCRYMVSKSYAEANRWATNWSRNTFVCGLLYRRKYAQFSQWVLSLEHCDVRPYEAFPMSMVTNLSRRLARYRNNKLRQDADRNSLGQLKKSTYRYWRSLAELIDATPSERLDENFPITGMDYLLDAHREGNGVILLSFHGIGLPLGLLTLVQRIGMKIFAVDYHTPIAQSQYRGDPNRLVRSVASTLNAEIALFGQRQLQQGKLISIVGDTSDPFGQARLIALNGHDYRIKTGFAELALNTGAKIIPHFGGVLVDGRHQLNLLPPLDPGNGDRAEQIDGLVNEYIAFINHVWVTRPEIFFWPKMKKHLAAKNGNAFKA